MTQPGPTERQPKETTPAFAAFRAYLEAGPTRSTASVARALGKSKTLMDRWCARWQWVERVRSFESAAASAVDTAHLDVIARRSKRQAEIAQLHSEVSATVAAEILRRSKRDPDWLKALDADALIRLASRASTAHANAVTTERLALGLSTANASAADSPRTAAEEASSRLSDDELEKRLSGVDELAELRDRKRPAKGATS